jgi:hypothetical protein
MASVAGYAVGTLSSPISGLIRAGYSLGQYAKHSWRGRTITNYNELTLKGCAFATIADVKLAYWNEFKRGVMEVVLPVLTALGWLLRDSKQEVLAEDVKDFDATSFLDLIIKVLKGPELRKLSLCEDIITDLITPSEPLSSEAKTNP